MFEDDFFGGVLVGAFLAAMFGVLVFLALDPNYPKDCDTLGAFRAQGTVYECHRKPAAQGVVE